MSEFALVAVVLVLVAAFFIIFPVMMNRGSTRQSRRQINAELFKVRLAELSQERDRGDVNEDEFQRLKMELERRLLEDVDKKDDNKTDEELIFHHQSKKVLIALFLSVPIGAWFLYGQIGAKDDWAIAALLKETRLADAAGQDGSALAKELTAKLSSRLSQRPNDPHYLMLLGNTEMSLQNYPAASAAYQRMVEIVPGDPRVLAQYAQALYLTSGRQLTSKVSEIVERTLAVQPNQPTVLGMLGIHNFENGEYQAAIDYWQRLLPSLGPVSPNSKMIREGIEQAKMLLEKQGGVVQTAQTETSKASDVVATAPASIQVDVSIDEKINAAADASVFIFARAVSGPKMPLAVARLRVSDLPAKVTLDDSMAMAPSLKLSSFEKVNVVARISSKGIANRSSGDIEGEIGPVTLGDIKSPLKLLINQVLP